MQTTAPPKAKQSRRRSSQGALVRAKSSRARSGSAVQALRAFELLRQYFESDAVLARALSWDVGTIGEWRRGRVIRPQRRKVTQVARLLQLAWETRPYLERDFDVGIWLTAPQPYLRGQSPATWLDANGGEGLQDLVRGLVDLMPRGVQGDLEPIDEESARRALQEAARDDKGVQEFNQLLEQLT